MHSDELQEFRLGFCKKAAELGLKPSELLRYIKYAKSQNIKTANALKDSFWLASILALAGGASLGGLAAYGVNKAEQAIDPSGDMFGDEADPVSETKKLQLIAKYRNAATRLSDSSPPGV